MTTIKVLSIAYGYDVTDISVETNGKIERYYNNGIEPSDPYEAWVYTHRLHNRDAFVNNNGVGICPKCGRYAIVKVAK